MSAQIDSFMTCVAPLEASGTEVSKDQSLWVLFEISCVLIYRSKIGRLRGIAEDGYDAKRTPFYLRPGATSLLRQLSTMSAVRIGITTSMMPLNYKPILDGIAKAAFTDAQWNENRYPVFNRATCPPHSSGETFPHGGPRMSRSVSAILQEAIKMGWNFDTSRLVLVNSHPNATEGVDQANMLLVTPCGPCDIAEPSHDFSNEFVMLLNYLHELALSDCDVRARLQSFPFMRRSDFVDIEDQERNPPALAGEMDFEEGSQLDSENAYQKDDVLTATVDTMNDNEWLVHGPERGSKTSYAWNGVRFLAMQASHGTSARFEVRVERGLVRVGWSTSHGLLDLGGGDRGSGFPYIGCDGAGNVCINGEQFRHELLFKAGDVLECELDRVSSEARYKKNEETTMHPIHFPTDAQLRLHPHIAGKSDFIARIRLSNLQLNSSFHSDLCVPASPPSSSSQNVLLWSVFQDPSTNRRWWCNPMSDSECFFDEDSSWRRYWWQDSLSSFYWWWNDSTQRMVIEEPNHKVACRQAAILTEIQNSDAWNPSEQSWKPCIDPLTSRRWRYNPLLADEYFFEDDVNWEKILYWDSLRRCMRVLWRHVSTGRVAFGD